MAVRTADARWDGGLPGGSGTMRFGSFEGAYSFASRMEEGEGTNPEQLIGAAHAGCFSMQLSGVLSKGGNEPESIETRARVHFDKAGEGWAITKVELDTEAKVPGLDDAGFQEAARLAKEICPVSQALKAVEITLNAKLAG